MCLYIRGFKEEIITPVDWSILALFAGMYGFSSGTFLVVIIFAN